MPVLVLLVYVTSLLHGAMAFAGRRALGDDPVRPPRVPAPFTTLAVGCWLLFAVWAGTAMWVARWLSPAAKTARSTSGVFGSSSRHLPGHKGGRALAVAALALLTIGALAAADAFHLRRASRSIS